MVIVFGKEKFTKKTNQHKKVQTGKPFSFSNICQQMVPNSKIFIPRVYYQHFYQGSQEKIKHVNHFWILAIVTTMIKLKIFNPDTIQTEFKTFHYRKSKLVLSVFLMSN